MPRTYQVPKGCPPELKALIEKMGTKVATFNAMNVSKDTFTRVVSGGEKMPEHWHALIEQVERGETIAPGGQRDEPAFKPWDGKKRSWTAKVRGQKKARIFKNVPSMVADLLDKYDGNISAASRACGVTGNTLTSMIDNKNEFNEKRQRIVFEGLNGVPAGSADKEGPDQYRMGIVLALMQSKNYDRVRDVAEILKGSVLWKMGTPVGWFVVYKLKGEDARQFKRIVERDCSKVACP